MSLFKSELIKILILLGVGFFLFMLVFTSNLDQYHSAWRVLSEPGTYGYLLYITFYPVGVVYGWDTMKSMWINIMRTDKSGEFTHSGANTVARTALTVGVAGAFGLIVAPVFGMIKAIIKLKKYWEVTAKGN